MSKKIFSAVALAALFMGVSCKKTEALSGADPASGTVTEIPAPQPEQQPEPDMVTIGATAPLPESNAPKPANGKYPVMSFAQEMHDFGTINENQKVTYTFEFKNTGQSDLIISNAIGSCGCTVPDYPKEPVKPGESGKIRVSFNPAGKQGNQQKTVTMATNTANGKEMLTIKANITPKA